MASESSLESTIEALHERGFQISIDDFGTGYSSWSRLHKLPVHILKIDKSCVDELADGASGAANVRTIQRLAGNLGFKTIAGGIETDTQRRRLIEINCFNGQGFLVSAAVPPDQLVTLLDHRFNDFADAERCGRDLSPSQHAGQSPTRVLN